MSMITDCATTGAVHTRSMPPFFFTAASGGAASAASPSQACGMVRLKGKGKASS